MSFEMENKLNVFVCVLADAPDCATPPQTMPANLGTTVTLVCEVDAQPVSNMTFHWSTKNTDINQMIESKQSKVFKIQKVNNNKSRLEVIMDSSTSFGQYSCSARNVAGVQREPCYYNVYGQLNKLTIMLEMVILVCTCTENFVEHQLVCETNVSRDNIQVKCQPNNQTSKQVYNLKIFKFK